MTNRKAISKGVRFEVFKRDGFVCQYCGAHPPKVILHVDHIHPVAEGGTNDADNLITACEPCNLGKGARLLSVAPETLVDKAARIAEAEAQLAGYAEVMEARLDRLNDDCWRVVEALTGESEIRKDRFRSVKIFVDRLGVHETLDSVDTTIRRGPRGSRASFLYFCKVCWNKINAGEGISGAN